MSERAPTGSNYEPTDAQAMLQAEMDKLRMKEWAGNEPSRATLEDMGAYLNDRPMSGANWVDMRELTEDEAKERARNARSPLEVGLFEGDVFYAAGQEDRSGKVVSVESVRDLKGESVYVVSTTLESNGSEQHKVMTETELRSYLEGMDLVDGGHERMAAEHDDLDGGYAEWKAEQRKKATAEAKGDKKDEETTEAEHGDLESNTPEAEQVNESEEDYEDETGKTGPKGRRKRTTRGDGRKIGGKNGQPGEQDVVGVDSEGNESSEDDDTPAAEVNAAQPRDTGNAAAESAAASSHESSNPEQSAGASEAAPASAAFVVGGNGVAERRTDGDSNNAAEQGADSSATPEEAAASVEEDEAATPSGESIAASAPGKEIELYTGDRHEDAPQDDAEGTPEPQADTPDSADDAPAPAADTPDRPTISSEFAKAQEKAQRYLDEHPSFFKKLAGKARASLSNMFGKSGAYLALAQSEGLSREQAEAKSRRNRIYTRLGAAGVIAVAGLVMWRTGNLPFIGDGSAPDMADLPDVNPTIPEAGDVGTSTPETASNLNFTIGRGQGGEQLMRNLGIDAGEWYKHQNTLLEQFPNDFYRMNDGNVGLANPSDIAELSQGARDYLTRLKNGA